MSRERLCRHISGSYLEEDSSKTAGNSRAKERIAFRERGDYSWIAHQLEIGTSLGRRHNYIGPISNLRPFLDSSAQTTQRNILDFFWQNLKRSSFDQFLRQKVFSRVFCQSFENWSQ